jgi:DNA polymerase III alpha subunit
MRVRSAYSFRYAYGKLESVFDRVLQLDWPAMPISDRMSTFGFVDWDIYCTKEGRKPVFGVELGVTAQLGQKKPSVSNFTFFAIDKLRSINELVHETTSKIGYPLMTYEEAIFAKDCIVIADNKVLLSEIYPHDNFYIALSPSTPIGLFREAKRKGFRFIASSDNVFPRDNDKLPYHVILNMNAETASYPQHILTDEEWLRALPYCVTDDDAIEAVLNRNNALQMCNAKLLKAEIFKIKGEFSLKQMCIDGAIKLNIDLNDEFYANRLKMELDLIHEKNFHDYFYIVADMVAYAKKHMIVGPARGSAAGSLVCYLTGITTIDPLKFDLLFERFIDVTRADLPDIDLDFSDNKRHLVFDYLKVRYGEAHAARLGSVMSYRPKSILNTAGSALGIPKWLCEKVADTLIERSSADSRAQQTFEETFYATDIGKKLVEEYPEIAAVFDAEDHPTNAGQHAAGMAIMNGEVLDYVAVDGRTGVIMADKYMAEKLNFLKIDVLGVSQLSIFERCLELIGKEPRNGFLETVPLDDQSAFDIMNRKQFSGIFQAMGKSLQILFNMIHTDRLDDLVAITALSRPGPVASGGAVRWTRRRSGKESAQYRHPFLEPYLKSTYGEVVYQEQVMSICRDIGQMGFREVTRIRKAMSKSLGVEEMNKLGEPFKEGAIKTGIPSDIVDIIWGELIEFGAWGFNLSHAVSYGMITYWCCWLKAHYPVEFAAATLDNEYDSIKQLRLLRELNIEGIKYVPIDAEHSIDKWGIKEENGKKILVGPLTNIHGVGPVLVKKIMESRLPGGAPLTPALRAKLDAAHTKIDSLTPIQDAIVPFMEERNIQTPQTPICELESGMHGQYMILGLVKRIQPRDLNDLHSVAKRGYALKGQSWCLNLFVHDDTDEILCTINRWDYERVGKQIEAEGGQGDVLYAIKGTIPDSFRMLQITDIRLLGRMSHKKKGEVKIDLFGSYQGAVQ